MNKILEVALETKWLCGFEFVSVPMVRHYVKWTKHMEAKNQVISFILIFFHHWVGKQKGTPWPLMVVIRQTSTKDSMWC